MSVISNLKGLISPGSKFLVQQLDFSLILKSGSPGKKINFNIISHFFILYNKNQKYFYFFLCEKKKNLFSYLSLII
jgi:hypothetical protein